MPDIAASAEPCNSAPGALAAKKSLLSVWWRPLVITVLTAILYHKIVSRLALAWWHDPNFSHGFFVPAISAWLAWSRRERLASLAARPSNIGFLGIIAALGVLFTGILGSELFLARTSLILLIGSLIVFFRGWAWLRELLFPWLLLMVAIPIPVIVFNQIAFPLQLLASNLASTLLAVIGVPVLREGNIINLPAMQLEVAEACSGIRSLMTLGTLALVYGYFAERSAAKRAVLALASIPIAIAANAARIFGTGVCVQYWDPSKAEGFFHEFSGWVIFVVALVLLLLTHAVLKIAASRRKTA